MSVVKQDVAMQDGESPNLQEGVSTPSATVSDSTKDKNHRKRMRVPTSCSVCRKRKIRCDKQKPVCSGCVKSNVHHLCHFEEPSWTNSEELLKHAKSPAVMADLAPTTQFPRLPASNGVTGLMPNSSTPMPSNVVIEGVNLNELSPAARKAFEELVFRVKHLEASIAVHDLSNSHTSAPGDHLLKQSSALPYSPEQNLNYYQINQNPPANGSIVYRPPALPETDSFNQYYDFDPNAPMNFYDYLPFMIKKTRLESHGPFSIVSMLRYDEYLKVLWIHMWKTIEKSQSMVNPQVPPTDQSMRDNCFAMLLDKGGKSLGGFLELRKRKLEGKAYVAQLKSHNLGLDDLILQCLPNKKTIMVLCFRFFKHVYPFMPFIIENSFFTEMDAIIGPLRFNNESIQKLHITSKYDYATLGLLLAVLRLAYLSISSGEFETNPDYEILKTQPVSAKTVHVMLECLSHYKFLRKSYSLKVVQLALYIKLYYRYCSEDDDVSDSSESQVLLGTIFAMAYNMGFNRDPIQLTDLTVSTKKRPQAQLWRRIWHKLIELDCIESISIGTPLHCRDDSTYDTPLPLEDPDDDEIDSFITQDFRFLAETVKLYRDTCNTCLNIKRSPSVLQIIRLVKKLESFIQGYLGSMKDIVNDSQLKPYARVKKISYLLDANSLLLSLNMALFRHFCSIGHQQKITEYLEECLTISLKIANSMLNLTYNEKRYFGEGFAYYLKPMANNAINKATMFLCAFTIRVLHAREIQGKTNPARYKSYTELADLLFANLENILQLLDKISAKQYNFARVVMAFRMFTHQLRDPAFSFKNASAEVSAFLLERSPEKLQHHHLHDLSPDKIPKTNFLTSLLDHDLSRIISKSKTDLVTILQPAVASSKFIVCEANYTENPNPTPEARKGFSSETFQSLDSNPVASSAAVSSESSGTPKTQPSPLNPTINFDDIFGVDTTVFGKIMNSATGNDAIAGSYDPTLLTSEEYASLFGLFEDYNSGSLEPEELLKF